MGSSPTREKVCSARLDATERAWRDTLAFTAKSGLRSGSHYWHCAIPGQPRAVQAQQVPLVGFSCPDAVQDVMDSAPSLNSRRPVSARVSEF